MKIHSSDAYVLPGLVQIKLNLKLAADIIIEELDTSMKIMQRKTRVREVVLKRHTVMYLLHWYGFGPSDIGRLFTFDHATVLHACRAIENDMLTNKDLKVFVRRMQHTCLRKD